jgi:uncharacterized protein
MTTDNKPSFLGIGWGFPVQFQRNIGTVRMVSEVDDIIESLTILLSTRPGERVLRPDYGCNLEDLLFEPMNESLLTYVKDLVTKAILFYEPRIEAKKINISAADSLEGRLLVEVEFVVRSSNTRFNFVYDYYLKEGNLKRP